MKIFPLVVAMLFATGVARAGKCKMTVRTTLKDGNKKLQIEEVPAESREQCKLIAKDRESKISDEIDKIKVSYGYR